MYNEIPVQKTSRINIFLIVIVITFIFYIIYLFFLQIVHGYEYKQRAQEISSRISTIPSQRGEIYDRNYDLPLVLNVDSFSIYIIPEEFKLKESEYVIDKLSTILLVDKTSIQKKIEKYKNQSFYPIEIKSGASYEQIIEIAEHINDFKGVSWRSKPIRRYVESGSISHVIGYVGEITRSELQVLFNKGYDSESIIGKRGIESQYDQILRGKDGKSFKTVDVKGMAINTANQRELPPELGKYLVLTIDKNIQHLCEKAIGDRPGSVVVLKPSTGEILALVSSPWFDPNMFYSKEGAEYYKSLSLDNRFPFINRAIQSSYSPASTFKVVLTTAIYEEELLSPEKNIYCEGKIWFGDRIFNCHKKSGHGYLNLIKGLAESCDVYFWTVGKDFIGIDRIIEYSHRYGLGENTNIDIPGEVPGLVPSPQWKENVYHYKWLGGDTLNTSIGQGYLAVTPIQMANLTAMIANEGVIYKPHLLKEVRDPISGKIIQITKPEIMNTSTIRKDTFKKVKNAMRTVITDGTAKWVITTNAVEVAAKTGTAELGQDDNWHSWFISYGPYNNGEISTDQIVVVVMVEAGEKWEWWAPKAANIIYQGIFANQTYEEAIKALRLWYLKE